MKATVHARLAGDRVANVVPPSYRPLLPDAVAPDRAYSVLLFAHTARDVVPSAPVRRALRRLGTPAAGGVVAVGTVFTAEALELLAAHGATVVAQRKGRWTDQSARASALTVRDPMRLARPWSNAHRTGGEAAGGRRPSSRPVDADALAT